LAQGTHMAATFSVSDVFRLSNVGVVVTGEVLDGSVKPGMDLIVPVNRSLNLRCRIASVEYVDRADEESEIGLVMAADGPEDVRLLLRLGLAGEVLRVVAPGEAASS
jgi:translation elongation factor EF-Tu-like GTPase